jgi:hypothetical protein
MTGHRLSEKSHSLDGTKTIGQINRELQDVYDGQPMTAGCAFCDWSFTGTAAAGREAAAFHRSTEHPEQANGRSPRDLLDRMDAGEPVAATTYRARKWNRETIIASFKKWAEEHDGRPPASTDWLKPTGGNWPQTSAVQREFGSWSAGAKAAGFEPRKRGPAPSSEEPKPEPVAADPPPTVEKPARRRRTRKPEHPALTQDPEPPRLTELVRIVTQGSESAAGFIEQCEQAAARHDTAAAAYRSIAAGIRTLEELAA